MTALGQFDQMPRVRMTDAPTPLERLENLEGTIGTGVRIYAKRDDAHPLAFGGNKVRQLEFYFGQARAEEADTVLITGAVQSNFCRLCAAFAAKLGMECHIQQEERVAKEDPLYRQSGNVLIEKMLGAHLHSYPHGEDEAGADAKLEEIADDLRASGRTPYVIHLAPGHAPLGALGYIVAAQELAQQLDALDVTPDEFIVPSGSGATHGGFLYGVKALGLDTPVMGSCVRRGAEIQRPRLIRRCQEIADLLQADNPVAEADIRLTEEFLAPGYGQLNPPTREAIALGAQTEALMLDPVYSGKCMAAVIDRARRGQDGETLVFLHTGGTPAIFAYANALDSEEDHLKADTEPA